MLCITAQTQAYTRILYVIRITWCYTGRIELIQTKLQLSQKMEVFKTTHWISIAIFIIPQISCSGEVIHILCYLLLQQFVCFKERIDNFFFVVLNQSLKKNIFLDVYETKTNYVVLPNRKTNSYDDFIFSYWHNFF